MVFAVYAFPAAYNFFYKPFFNYLPGIDVVSTSLLPVSILQRGDFLLDEYRDFFFSAFRSPGFIFERDGHLISRSPVVAAILAIPFYGVPLGSGWLIHPTQDWLTFPPSAFFVGKIASIVLSALAALAFFFCARELTSRKLSVGLTLVFAFGTSVWSTNSQGLWQHTPSVLFQLLGIWFILRGHRAGAQAVAPGAFFFSMATIARPNNIIPAGLFTIYVVLVYRSTLVKWILWAIPPALCFFIYNAIYNGSPLVWGYQEGVTQYVTLPQIQAFAGLILSPSRGLLIYSPFFIFAVVGAWMARLEKQRLFYGAVTASAVLGFLLLCMYTGWDAGWGYGTRYMTDLLPYLTLLLIPVVARMSLRWRWVFAGTVVYSFVLQAMGLWDYGARWHWHWDNWDYDIWNLAENEPLFYVRQYFQMGLSFLGRFGR